MKLKSVSHKNSFFSFHSVSSFFPSFWHEGCNDILGIKKETTATRSNDQTNRREGSEFLIDHWGYSMGRADPSLQSLSDVNKPQVAASWITNTFCR